MEIQDRLKGTFTFEQFNALIHQSRVSQSMDRIVYIDIRLEDSLTDVMYIYSSILCTTTKINSINDAAKLIKHLISYEYFDEKDKEKKLIKFILCIFLKLE